MRNWLLFLALVIAIGGYGYHKNAPACQKLGLDIFRDTTAIFVTPAAGISRSPLVAVAATRTTASLGPGNESQASMSRYETDNYAQGATVARQRGKKLLLFFTGSDYCPPCQETVRDVFPTEVFQNFVSSGFIMVTLDYPRYKPQSAELITQNNALHQKYNIQGVPTFIITDVDGTEIKRSIGGTSDPNLLISSLGGTP